VTQNALYLKLFVLLLNFPKQYGVWIMVRLGVVVLLLLLMYSTVQAQYAEEPDGQSTISILDQISYELDFGFSNAPKSGPLETDRVHVTDFAFGVRFGEGVRIRGMFPFVTYESATTDHSGAGNIKVQGEFELSRSAGGWPLVTELIMGLRFSGDSPVSSPTSGYTGVFNIRKELYRLSLMASAGYELMTWDENNIQSSTNQYLAGAGFAWHMNRLFSFSAIGKYRKVDAYAVPGFAAFDTTEFFGVDWRLAIHVSRKLIVSASVSQPINNPKSPNHYLAFGDLSISGLSGPGFGIFGHMSL
jgi:hypothetical protein